MKQSHSQRKQVFWWRALPWSFLRLVFGGVLLLSAFLKFQSIGVGSSLMSELMPQFELLTIQIEVLIGVWLLSGWWASLSKTASLVLFSVFFGASLVMVVQGRSTCGCLGAASVSPVWMLLFDAFAILTICWSQVDISNTIRSSQGEGGNACSQISRRGLLLTITAASVAGALFISLSPAIASKVAQFSGYGQTLSFEPAIYDAGTGTPGEWKMIPVRIRNNGSAPVRLLGGKDGCSCRTLHSLPLTIAPGSLAEFEVSVKFGETPGVQASSFWLLTDCREQGTLLCRWKAIVTPAVDFAIASKD